jgi:hypothetical protein
MAIILSQVEDSKSPQWGMYFDLALNKAASERANVFTVFVNYKFGPGPDDFSTEEIDVIAATVTHAKDIAKAALARDYEPGGKIVHVEERVRGTMFL